MANEVFVGSGDPGSYGCGQRDQSCLEQLSDCGELQAEGRGREYWIFNAVQKMQGTRHPFLV